METKKRRKPRAERIDTRVPPYLYELLKEWAQVRERAVSEILREFLVEHYEEIKARVEKEKSLRGLG